MAQSGSLGNEKPHSAVTSLIDILTLPKYDEDDLEGITELVEVINLQTTGPTEASRAIRKKVSRGMRTLEGREADRVIFVCSSSTRPCTRNCAR